VSEISLARKATMRLNIIYSCQLSGIATIGKLRRSPTPQIIFRKLKNHREQAQEATIYRVHQVLMRFRITTCQQRRTYVTKCRDLIHKRKDTHGDKTMVSEFRRVEIEVFNSIIVSFLTLNYSFLVTKLVWIESYLPSSHNEA
jgi:hypothetical protein